VGAGIFFGDGAVGFAVLDADVGVAAGIEF